MITTSALESELQALLLAMQNCWSQGFMKVCFEGDNKEVSDIINGGRSHFGAFNWIRDIQAWKKRFQDCRFQWVKRKQNKPADILAKTRIPRDLHFMFYSYVPTVITDAVRLDYSSIQT